MTVASNNPLLGFECRRAEVYLSPGARSSPHDAAIY